MLLHHHDYLKSLNNIFRGVDTDGSVPLLKYLTPPSFNPTPPVGEEHDDTSDKGATDTSRFLAMLGIGPRGDDVRLPFIRRAGDDSEFDVSIAGLTSNLDISKNNVSIEQSASAVKEADSMAFRFHVSSSIRYSMIVCNGTRST